MEMLRKTYAEVNLDNLAHNVEFIRGHFPNQFLCPMVKANAYGHGDVQISRCLEDLGIQTIGVCLIEEGLLLRHFDIRTQILVFRGFDREGVRQIIDFNLTPVVSTWAHLQHLESQVVQPLAVHVKFNTGMNRLGFRVEEARRLFEYFWQNKKLRVEAVLTHLSQGEDGHKEKSVTAEQIGLFSEALEIFKALDVKYHVLNSGGMISAIKIKKEKAQGHILSQPWGLRPGLMLYGYNPLENIFPVDIRPVMNLKSHVSVFRQLKKGEGLSYNSTWRAPVDSVIGVVPIGYADGYHRILSNRSEALFLGERVPVVGNVCMDYLMVDVTQVLSRQKIDFNREHEVTLLGQDEQGQTVSAHELAQKAQTIPWEILTSVGERVPRVFRGPGAGESSQAKEAL